jgi:hypothetical protein
VNGVLCGTVLLLLTIFFYIRILATEIGSPLAVEEVNYVGDTRCSPRGLYLPASEQKNR